MSISMEAWTKVDTRRKIYHILPVQFISKILSNKELKAQGTKLWFWAVANQVEMQVQRKYKQSGYACNRAVTVLTAGYLCTVCKMQLLLKYHDITYLKTFHLVASCKIWAPEQIFEHMRHLLHSWMTQHYSSGAMTLLKGTGNGHREGSSTQ